MENIKEVVKQNRAQLLELIKFFESKKHYGDGKKNLIKAVQKYNPKFGTPNLANWLGGTNCRGVPFDYCFLFEVLTNNKFNIMNLRYDIREKIRKAYISYRKKSKKAL